MANVPQKTLSWLWDVVRREYHDPNRTYSDLAQTLSHYPTFAPRTDVYTYENGVHALLVHLQGTVPVTFRGNTYRFPIALWIPHAYPHEPPVVYVKPTDDMIVRQGQHVAGDGRVYHHYLAHWREAWDRSNITDFLAILSDIFAREPPVMAKAQAGRLPQQPQSQPPPPRPPLPAEVQRPPSHPGFPSHQPGPPPPPPPPPKPFAGQDSASTSSQQGPGRYDAPPPLPKKPENSGRPPSFAGPGPQGNGSVHLPRPVSQYMPQRVESLRAQPQPPQQHQQPPPQARPQILSPPGQGPPPGQPHQPPHHMHVQHHQPTHHLVHGHNQQSRPPPQASKPPQPSLLDSPFDIPLPVAQQNLPAPPIPRNPEKDALLSHLSSVLTSSLHSQIAHNASAVSALQSQNAALQATAPRLQAEIASISALQETLKSNISLLQTSMTNADTAIARARQRSKAGDVPNVDDMLVPPHLVGKQLYDTVAEERGLEAAIFGLQEAFVRGRISSDVWSRRTRELAREGFKKKYLTQKIGQGIGLDS